jgi:ferredoxin
MNIKEGDNFMTATTTTTEEILGEYLECACGGNMSCSTCHIILDEVSFHKLDPPCEAECDMLDLAFEPTDTSRLGCQVIMTKELDGMTITIPSGVNNFWS